MAETPVPGAPADPRAAYGICDGKIQVSPTINTALSGLVCAFGAGPQSCGY